MTKVIWREYYTPAVVKELAAMRTLPRYETEVDARFVKPHEIIEELAQLSHNIAGESFNQEEKIEVLEPAALAGTWNVSVDWNPEYSARKVTADD